MRKFFGKKSSKDSDTRLPPPSTAESPARKPRDRALRQSASLPHLGWNYNQAIADNTFAAATPHDPYRAAISQPLDRFQSYAVLNNMAMQPEAIAAHRKPQWPEPNKHKRKATVDKADIILAKDTSLVMNISNQGDHISTSAQRGAPPQPPSKLVHNLDSRKQHKFDSERRREESEVLKNMIDQFPVPPVQGLPEFPPCNLPPSPPVFRGGTLVAEPLLRRRLDKPAPEPKGPLPDLPASVPKGSQFPVLGSRDGVPAHELLPSPKTDDFRERFRRARKEKEDRVPTVQRSASATVQTKASMVDFAQTTVTPREWASPAVLYDPPRSKPGHQRLASNPDPPTQYHRDFNKRYEGVSLREKEGPRAHQVRVTNQPKHRPAQSVDTQAEWGRHGLIDVQPTSNSDFYPTAPLNVRSKDSRPKISGPTHLDEGFEKRYRDHHRLHSTDQQTTHHRGDQWTYDIPNARLKAGRDIGDVNIGLPMKLQPHSRSGSASSSSTMVGSSSGHGHGYSSSSDSTNYKDKSYPPVVRSERRGIVRSKLNQNQYEEQPATAEFGLPPNPGYHKSSVTENASLGNNAREHRRRH